MPTKVIVGNNCVANNAEIFWKMGKKAVIVTGKHSAKANGALGDVVSVLAKNGQEYCIFDRVMPNPTVECVFEGGEFAKSQNADFVVAIGGGSPMDSAKIIALLAAQDIKREDIFSGKFVENKILPMIHIPTTAGTGSEVTQYSILTNCEKETKMSVASDVLFPNYALLDGKYMENLSKSTTINTAVDALSHCVEGMLSSKAGDISNTLAKRGISLISSCFDALKRGEFSTETREKLLLGSAYGGMTIAQTGTVAVHSMGYCLTYFRNVDHGRANGLLLGEYIEFAQTVAGDKVREILGAMGFERAEELTSFLFEVLERPVECEASDVAKFTKKAMSAKSISKGIAPPDEDVVERIYRESILG